MTVDNNNFIIWNRTEGRIIVDDLIKEYAAIEFAAPYEEITLNDKWEFNKVVIRKTKRFDLNAAYAGDIIVQLCEDIMKKALDECNKKKKSKFQKLREIKVIRK